MKILLGYDGSNAAKDALKLAIEHAKAFKADIMIVRSRTTGDMDEVEGVRQAREELEAAKQMIEAAGVACGTHLLIRGLSAGEDIVQFAREQGAVGIVIGVRRRSRTGKALFGSTAQYIILNAPCPVTTIR
jgi:nucleotide-binding universal stress UspA family protein